MKILSLLTIAVALATMTPCATLAGDEHPDEDEHLDELVAWMSGHFDSSAQAAQDSAFFDISLVMVPIWTDRDDGRWLYVEQAVNAARERPYRQRVYRVVSLEPGLFKSEVYAFGDPLSRAGAWRNDEPLADLTPADLELREGCAVLLRRDAAGRYSGGTVGRGCGSTLRGAAYATSEVDVGPEELTSWDRGFDADGAQVWGAETGPYVFIRVEAPAAD